ncbi:hypothetical protein AWB82_05737 [Caballeronia glebae]|uniref:Uncharacterized protein n=1 Tax=Caballeronia glebae TaxID=1777143 RepID=A0A158CSV8_9BURK|nr:hypothetical protein AWB82_05737 [Caballeronia glebae]
MLCRGGGRAHRVKLQLRRQLWHTWIGFRLNARVSALAFSYGLFQVAKTQLPTMDSAFAGAKHLTTEKGPDAASLVRPPERLLRPTTRSAPVFANRYRPSAPNANGPPSPGSMLPSSCVRPPSVVPPRADDAHAPAQHSAALISAARRSGRQRLRRRSATSSRLPAEPPRLSIGGVSWRPDLRHVAVEDEDRSPTCSGPMRPNNGDNNVRSPMPSTMPGPIPCRTNSAMHRSQREC